MIKVRVSIYGMGYIGLTTAVFLAQHTPIICVENNKSKLEKLRQGIAPIYEPNIQNTLTRIKTNILFTDDFSYAVQNTDLSFVTVGTPTHADGSQNLDSLTQVLTQIGKSLRSKDNHHIIVIKSTTLPGTTENIVVPILEKTSEKNHLEDFTVLYNPEFTREGQALNDLTNPDKIVIGTRNDENSTLHQLYRELYPNSVPIIITTYSNAELIKYTQNAFLATKLSFINTIANLCETIPGTDIESISKAISLDPRISPEYLNAGLGYGGSCLPKDLNALERLAKENKQNTNLFGAIKETNNGQPLRAVEIAEKILGNLTEKTISILGLSFKPNTDDIREAPAIKIIHNLLGKNSRIKVYDPKAMENTHRIFGEQIEYSENIQACLESSDCCIIATEWNEFRNLISNDFEKMNRPIVIDGRNIMKDRSGSYEYRRIGLHKQHENEFK